MPKRIPHPRIVFAVVLALAAAACAADGPDADESAALREFHSGNGLLNRGLYDLAAAEYRKFLSQHAGHSKAPVARYGLAVSLQRLGKSDEAAVELARLAARPDFEFRGEVAVLLGQHRLTQGEPASAVEVLEPLVAKEPGHPLAGDAAALLVEALHRAGRHEAAASAARDFAERWPSNAARERVTLVAGLALMGERDWPAAAERFAELVRRAPSGPLAEQAEVLLAQCHAQRGAADEAERCYQAVLARKDGKYLPDALLALAGGALRKDKPQDAAALVDRALHTTLDRAQRCTALVLRARAAVAMDRPDEALELLKDAPATCDELGDQIAYWRAKALLTKGAAGGHAAARNAESPPAVQQLEAAIAKYPQSSLLAEMRYERALALMQAGQDEQAIPALDEFLARHAEHNLADSAALRLGALHCRGQRYDAAIVPLTRVAEHVEAHPELCESLLLLGDVYLQRGEWTSAEEWLTKYVAAAARLRSGAQAPDALGVDEALLKLGVARERQGRAETALAAFVQLLEQYPSSPHRAPALFEKGQMLLSLGRTDEAAAALEQVAKDEAGGHFRSHAWNHLGAIATQKKQFTDAAEYFGRASESAEDDSTAASALAQQGQALLAAEQYAAAEPILAKFVARYPTNEQTAAMRARLAVALARADRPTEALAVMEQVERSGPLADGALSAAARYEKAWCLRKLGKQDDAMRTYRELLAEARAGGQASSEGAGPQRAHAALELAELLAVAGHCDEALQLLQPLRGAASEFAVLDGDAQARLLYRSGACAFDGGKYEECVAALEELLKSAPQHALAASASFFCGEACFQLRRYAQAVEHLTRVVTERKADETYGPSLLRLGECLGLLERWQRCEEVFGQYLRELAGSVQWYQAQFGVGWARENLGRHDEAITAYRLVIERHKGSTAARAQFQIGECLYAKKKYQDAVAELLKVEILYAYPEWSAAALYEAGRCLEELGKSEEARRQFEAVRSKYGQTRWANLATQRLAASAHPTLPGRVAQ